MVWRFGAQALYTSRSSMSYLHLIWPMNSNLLFNAFRCHVSYLVSWLPAYVRPTYKLISRLAASQGAGSGGRYWGGVGEVLGRCWGGVGELLGRC